MSIKFDVVATCYVCGEEKECRPLLDGHYCEACKDVPTYPDAGAGRKLSLAELDFRLNQESYDDYFDRMIAEGKTP